MASRSKARDIVEQIGSLPRCPRHVLILCPDRIRTQRVISLITNTFFKAATGSGVTAARIDSRELNPARLTALADQLNSPSLFSPVELFVLDHCHDLSVDLSRAVAALLPSIPESSCLILTAEKLARTTPIMRYFEKHELLIELVEMKGLELKRWLQRELKQEGITECPEDAINCLLELGCSSPDLLHPLVQHAALYNEGSGLTLAELRQLFIARVEPSEFELVDAIRDRNPARAEMLLGQLLVSGRSPFALLAMIARVYLNYLRIRLLLSRGRAQEQIKQALGMTPWVFSKSLTAAKSYSLGRLQAIQSAILMADSRLKNRSLGPDLVLSELIGELRP